MLKYKLNNSDITEKIKGKPVITQSKSYLDKGIVSNIVELTATNITGQLTPLSGNNIYDSDNLTENTIDIFNDNTLLFSGNLIDILKSGSNLLLKGVNGLYKYLDNELIIYSTANRGDGTIVYDPSEYNYITDAAGYTGYYETPAGAVLHILKLKYPLIKLDLNSFAEAITNYNSGNCNIQVNLHNINLRELLNYISDKFFLYLYVNDNGQISCLHGKNYKADSIEIENNQIKNIDTVKSLRLYNDYYIQKSDNQYETDTDNNDIGSTYRTSFIQPLTIDSYGYIIIADTATAVYIGEYAINNFHSNREGINFDISLTGNDIISFNKGIRVSSAEIGFTNKYFEIFKIKKNIQSVNLNITAYEIL